MNSKLKIEALILAGFSILSKALAFGREILLASYFGTSAMLDAYYAGTAFSNFLLFFFSGGAFIPLLVSFYTSKEKKGKLNGFVIFLLLLSIIMSVFTIFGGDLLIEGVRGSIANDALFALRVTSFTSFFYVLSSVIRAMLNSIENYRLSGLQDFVMILVIICGILLTRFGNPLYILSVSFLISGLFRVLVQIPAFFKNRKRFDLKVVFDWKEIIKYSKSFFPLMLVIMVPQLFVVYTRNVGASLPEGALSGLSFAERTSDIAKSIVAFSLGAVIVTPLSRAIANGKKDEFKNLLSKALNYVFFLSIPIALLFLLMSKEIVSILYLRGNFDTSALSLVSQSLQYYSLASLLSSPIYIVATALYTRGDWRRFLLIAIVSVLLGYVTVNLLVQSLGVYAIAVGVGVYSLAFYAVSHIMLSMELGSLNIGLNIVKQIVANTVGFTIGYLLYIKTSSWGLLMLIPIIISVLLIMLKEAVAIELLSLVKKISTKK